MLDNYTPTKGVCQICKLGVAVVEASGVKYCLSCFCTDMSMGVEQGRKYLLDMGIPLHQPHPNLVRQQMMQEHGGVSSVPVDY